MDPKFVKKVQTAGWHITSVTEDAVVGSCPSVGCGLKAKLEPGGIVPDVDPGCRRNRLDEPVEDYDDIRRALRGRREDLGLTIREVEEIGGISVDFLAKFEKDDPSKTPNAQTLIEWAQALGYEIVLRPGQLTPYAVRTLCDTRDKYEARTRRFSIESRRRGQRAEGKR